MNRKGSEPISHHVARSRRAGCERISPSPTLHPQHSIPNTPSLHHSITPTLHSRSFLASFSEKGSARQSCFVYGFWQKNVCRIISQFHFSADRLDGIGPDRGSGRGAAGPAHPHLLGAAAHFPGRHFSLAQGAGGPADIALA